MRLKASPLDVDNVATTRTFAPWSTVPRSRPAAAWKGNRVSASRYAPRRRSVARIASVLSLVLTAVPVFTEQATAAKKITRTSAPALKPVLRGVVDRQKIAPDATYRQTVNAAVIKAKWSDLQPTAFGPIEANNVIDEMVAHARRLNQDDAGLGMRLKLRVYAGVSTPEWGKHLDGAPVSLVDPRSGAAIGTVPRFWTDNFKRAYDDLMTKLAARYESEPLIADVVISRCTTQFAEPFLRQGSVAANRSAYFAAGYTVSADKQCLGEQIDTHARLWKTTRSSIAFNPFQLMATDRVRQDEPFTESMMAYCRQMLAQRCVLGNNSISSPLDGGNYTLMYNKIQAMGAPIYFQTTTLAKIGDWRATLDWARGAGASMIELPAGYDPAFGLSDLGVRDAALEANPA